MPSREPFFHREFYKMKQIEKIKHDNACDECDTVFFINHNSSLSNIS